MREKGLLVKVSRYDPSQEISPVFEDYRVPFTKGMSVIDALRYVRENCDSSLAFRYRCRVGYCGSCSLLVNGTPRLACMEEIDEGIQSLVIEPLPNFPVIRDLVVDLDAPEKNLLSIRPFLERREPFQGVWPLKDTEFGVLEELSRCMSCMSCMGSCPVFSRVPQKFPGPWHLLNIGRFAFDPRDEADRARMAFFQGLYLCAFCGKCEEVCPSEIRIPHLVIQELRRLVAHEMGLLPGHRELVDNLKKKGETLVSVGRTFLEEAPHKVSPDKIDERVGLFVGCVADVMEKDSLGAAVDILSRNNVEVVIPKDQLCCGNLELYGITLKDSRQIARRNAASFEREDLEVVLTVCPACGFFLKNEYTGEEGLLERQPSFKVEDINEFLSNYIKFDPKDFREMRAKVTWHDPCHLKREQKIFEEPRKILQMIPGVEFVEMREPDRCCGGTLRASAPDVADLLGMDKVRQAHETGADYVLTSCPLCISHLLLSRAKAKIRKPRVMNILNFIAKAYR